MPKSSTPEFPECLLVNLSPEGVLTITLNRPDALNAFDDELSAALQQALKYAEKAPEVRCIVLTGSGRGFCAGQDLKSRSVSADNGSVPHLGESIEKRYAPIINKLNNIEKPVIAAINGVAAGAGASLAFACDMRLAVPEAKFIQAFVKVGLIPDSGACWLLPRLIGLGRAIELCMTGTPMSAEQGLAWGAINRIVSAENLLQETLTLATQLAQGPAKALGLMKRAFPYALEHSLSDYLAYEANLQEIAGRTSDYKEGVSAFSEKRQPAFQGK